MFLGKSADLMQLYLGLSKSSVDLKIDSIIEKPGCPMTNERQRPELVQTTQHNTTQHNTTQHNTTQHNTTQHNTTQHNTTQHIMVTVEFCTIFLSCKQIQKVGVSGTFPFSRNVSGDQKKVLLFDKSLNNGLLFCCLNIVRF